MVVTLQVNLHITRELRGCGGCVSSTYNEVFLYIEGEGTSDPENELDSFVLHCAFLPVINWSLDSFTHDWNQHPLRTKRYGKK